MNKLKIGNFTLVKSNKTIICNSAYEYEIDMEGQHYLDWLEHLSHKIWFDQKDVDDFLLMVNEVETIFPDLIFFDDSKCRHPNWLEKYREGDFIYLAYDREPIAGKAARR